MRALRAALASVALGGCAEEAPPYAVDDSWRNIERPVLEAGVKVLEGSLTDPVSMQLRRLAPSKLGGLCGEVNAKNRMGGYVGFAPFVTASQDGGLLLGDSDPRTEEEIAMNQVIEATIVVSCPGWTGEVSDAAKDAAFYAQFPKEDIPASIKGFCGASYIKLTDVNQCIGAQLQASIAARAMLDNGEATDSEFEICMRKAGKAGGYSDLNDVRSCMLEEDFDTRSLDLKGQAPSEN